MKLRFVEKSDYQRLFEIHDDAQSHLEAGFSQLKSRDEYFQHLDRILSMDTVILKIIEVDGEVVGNIGKWVMQEQPELMYWIDRKYMGRGLATQAVQLFLHEFTQRPIYAHTAADNIASNRVLEKNGFLKVGELRSFADARGEEILEYEWKLD